jgi:hypothetical protein
VTNTGLFNRITAMVLLFLSFGIWWLWWRLPKWQVSHLALEIVDPKARADIEDNFRKTVGQALGGAAVLIGAVFALFQFLQQQKAAYDLLISNQVSKGFEQLAGDKMAMRLGGIYALEGVMNTSEQYHGSVLEGLCAFVRENAPRPASEDDLVVNKPATDVQAALTVGRREMRREGTERIDLAYVSIPRANLTEAILNGANLRGADLRDAHLTGARLSGAALSSANLTIANLRDANLSDADLNDANLNDATLTGANLSDAIILGANLTGANLSSVRNLTPEQLNKACGNADTKLPEGLTLKACKEE